MTPEQMMQDFKKRAEALKEWFEKMNKICDGKSLLFITLISIGIISGLSYLTRHIDHLASRYNQNKHQQLISDSRRK